MPTKDHKCIYTYKMNFLSTKYIIENLTILFTVSDESRDKLRDVLFALEEEI